MAIAQKTDILDQLRAGIEQLTSSEQWTRWLDVQRRFHHYSWGNCLLISLQRPDATYVAGYRRWQQLKRQVRKGEKGIAILAPIVNRVPRSADRDDDAVEGEDVLHVVRAFRTAFVFDVTQTDGEPLPQIAQRLLGEDPADAFYKLQAVAGALDFSVEVTPLGDSLNGDCHHGLRRIRVNADVSPKQGVKTLAHEIAHALLHGPSDVAADMPRALKELEAESVAYVVCSDLGIDSGEYSFGYVAGWAGGGDAASKAISASAQRIQQAAHGILDALEPMAALEQEGVA